MIRTDENNDLLIKPISQFKGPAAGSVMITLNTTAAGLRFLIDDAYGQRYFSRDEAAVPGEDIEGVQRLLNTTAGRAAFPGEFACLAARVARNHPRQHRKLLEYGNVVLVAAPERLRGDLVVFNGDFKSIGFSRRNRADSIKAWSHRRT